MAVELGHFIAEQLARLPADHPDRAFLAGIGATVAAYADVQPASHGSPQEPIAGDGDAAAPLLAAEVPESARLTVPVAEQERVRISGRLGAAPTFRVTPRSQQRVATFPLAEHQEPDRTIWHRVVAFNKPDRPLADRVEALDLTKGSVVDVVGYRHERDVRSRTVEADKLVPRTLTEIYAVAVRKR